MSRSVQRLPSLTPTNNFANQWLGKARFSLWKKKPSCVCVAAPVVPEISACSRAEQSSVETESRRSASCENGFISFSFHSFQIFLQEYSNQKLTQMVPAFWCDLDASAQAPLPLSTMPYLFTIIKATFLNPLRCKLQQNSQDRGIDIAVMETMPRKDNPPVMQKGLRRKMVILRWRICTKKFAQGLPLNFVESTFTVIDI